MNKTLGFLLTLTLLGCSFAKKNEPSNYVDALVSRSDKVSEGLKKVTIKAEPALAADKAGKLVGLSAASAQPYLGWVKTSVGFPKGETSEDKLQSLGLDLPYSWRVLKKWDDGSPKIAQFKTVGYFNGHGVIPVNLSYGKTPKQYFSWHPALLDAIVMNRFGTELKIQVSANNVALDCVPASGQFKFLVADATEIVVRFRSHCFNRSTLEPHALSLTSYFTLMADDPVVRMQHVLGNDTLEQPIQGGVQLSNVQVVSGNLPQVRFVNEPSYGNKSPFLGDGQTMAFKTVVALDPMFNSTAEHIATGEPMGFQLYQDAVASNAFGTGTLPPTRIPADGSIIQAQHVIVNNQANLSAQASASSFLGMINRCPPDTGGQPDFANTAPIDVQKAMQAYSSKQMAAVLLATYRESYRPSFYWETRGGYEDRANAVNHPNLFFWSGRTHYDWSWNQDQDQKWRSRTGSFVAGSFSNWCPMDNQHNGNNHVRFAVELTGDPYLEDVLKYYVSVNNWNYFTDWLPNVEADRAFGRATKEAIALTELFPDLPESQLLKPRIQTKLTNYRTTISSVIQRFGHTAGVLSDACDPRINQSGAWPICPIQQSLNQGNIAVVGWQIPFALEVQAIVPNPDLRILAAAEEFFESTGEPKTIHLVTDPLNYKTGGIGIQWWASWVTLAQKYPDAPGAGFVLKHVKPVIDARMQNGCGFPSPYFCLNDNFRGYKP